MPQTLLHILVGAERGGCERCCETLIRYLPDVRHRVLSYCAGGPMVSAWQTAGAVVDLVDVGRVPTNAKLVAHVAAYAAEHKPTAAVLWHGMVWLPQLTYGLRSADIPVAAYGGNPALTWPWWMDSRFLLYDWWFRAPRRPVFICCSRYVADSFQKRRYMAKFPAEVVFNGVELPTTVRPPAERLDPAGPITVGMLARLDPIKDQATVIRAVAQLRSGRLPSVRLELAGAGTEEARLRALARELGVEPAVTFLGNVADVYGAMAKWDLFAYATTEYEGLGSALAEGLIAGLPCVATDAGPIRELCGDGANALLAPPGDAAALAATLAKLAEDDGLRRDLAASGRTYALAQFHPAVFAQRYADILFGGGHP